MKSRFKNSGWFWAGQGAGCPTGSAEARQIGLLRRAQKAAAPTGCPIDFQQAAEFPVLPEGRADQGEEPGEAVAPLTQVRTEAQEHIGQQRRPHLPFDGVGVVAEEVGQLQGLFEFFEEDLDAPAAAVEVSDGLGAPRQVVGQENHFPQLAVHLDKGGDAAQFDWINRLHRRIGQDDQVVPQNVTISAFLKLANDSALQVVLGPGDPKDAALGQVGEVGEVEVSLVEDNDFTRLNIGTKLAGPPVVVLAGGGHDGATGQKSLEVEADMALGSGLAPTMLGPVQRAGHQLDGGGVNDMNKALEAKGEPGAMVAAEGGLQGLQMFQHRPEELFGHFRISPAVGVRKRVFGRRRGPAQCRQRPRVQTQGVANVIESEAVGQLRVEQADDVTPRTEGAGLIIHAGLACQSRHQMRRNEVAKLAQQREFAGGWLVSSLIIHALPCGKAQTRKPTFFYTSTLNPVGQQCYRFTDKNSRFKRSTKRKKRKV